MPFAPKSDFRRCRSVLSIESLDQELKSLRPAVVVTAMKIVCAWCCREGQPGYLGEREPLDNPEPTHGICAYHTAQLLESLPSRSFPDAEMLVVVHGNNTVLYEDLKRSFAALSRVQVIMDRRVSDRRAAPPQELDERRRLRTRRIREGTISPLGHFTIVWFTPKAQIRLTDG